MSHVEMVEVHGLLGRSSHVGIDFDRNLNVIFGLNGSGKTSLLNILKSALARDGKYSQWVPFKHAKVRIYSTDQKSSLDHHLVRSVPAIDARKPPTPTIADPSVQVTLKSEAPLRTAAWAHEFLPAYRIYEYVARAPTVSEFNLHAADIAFESAMSDMWLRIASGIQQRISTLQTEAMGRIVAALISSAAGTADPGAKESVDPQEAYNRLLKFFGTQFRHPFGQREFRQGFEGSPNLRSVVSILEDLEGELATARVPQTKLQEFLASLYSSGKQVSLLDNRIEILVPEQGAIGVRSLSSGEKHILRLLLGAYRAGYSSLLIDEPELSLHVGWQERLVPMIREMSPQAQIIMATHSPEIVHAVERLKGRVIDLDKL